MTVAVDAGMRRMQSKDRRFSTSCVIGDAARISDGALARYFSGGTGPRIILVHNYDWSTCSVVPIELRSLQDYEKLCCFQFSSYNW
jgi:hypothetical protein